MAITIIVLVFAILYNIPYNIPISLFGFLGIPLVYKIFSYYSALFNEKTKVGRSLSYIGKNTLQIYFLHYFLLPRNLSVFGEFLQVNSNPVIELVLGLSIAVVVIAISLMISNVIRISPLLAHILFGAKR